MPNASASELSPYMPSASAGERAVPLVGEPLPYMPGASAGELSPYMPSASAGERAVRAEFRSAIPRRTCRAPRSANPATAGELSPYMPSASAGKVLSVMLNREEASRPARGSSST
ncbi:hypothetical protein T492DRAFT_979542 [Pavlovales sp. CCMP2436]|nr:hypothetical protein T492DRAFT_979542 [Pavlovales sp. CCMP2436]